MLVSHSNSYHTHMEVHTFQVCLGVHLHILRFITATSGLTACTAAVRLRIKGPGVRTACWGTRLRLQMLWVRTAWCRTISMQIHTQCRSLDLRFELPSLLDVLNALASRELLFVPVVDDGSLKF